MERLAARVAAVLARMSKDAVCATTAPEGSHGAPVAVTRGSGSEIRSLPGARWSSAPRVTLMTGFTIELLNRVVDGGDSNGAPWTNRKLRCAEWPINALVLDILSRWIDQFSTHQPPRPDREQPIETPQLTRQSQPSELPDRIIGSDGRASAAASRLSGKNVAIRALFNGPGSSGRARARLPVCFRIRRGSTPKPYPNPAPIPSVSQTRSVLHGGNSQHT